MAEDNARNVKVALRVRIMSGKEVANNEVNCVTVTDQPGQGQQLMLEGPETVTFAFDHVFAMEVDQPVVFEHVGKPVLESALSGYNATIFAYGQTGSGKSYCMAGTPTNPGIIPRVNELLWQRVEQETRENEGKKFLVQCSYFEIYNEIIFDLLNPPTEKGKLQGGLQIKEHAVFGIYVKDLTDICVTDTGKLATLMDQGNKNRAVSSTMMNATSSRSHSIFTIKVSQKADKGAGCFAKINLVDLAGSERQKGTQATGKTLQEGANINKSLSALGNVINALVESANTGKKVFIPYRNSKLTRVLQESLGGNSLCTMLATLSPALSNFEETMSTVRYAQRAKAIKVNASKNEEASTINRLESEIAALRKQLASQTAKGGDGGMSEAEKAELQTKYATQIAEMDLFMKQTWEEKSKISAQHEQELKQHAAERAQAAERMEQERIKRWKLLEAQDDVEVTLKALEEQAEATHALRLECAGASGSMPTVDPAVDQSTCGQLLSGKLATEWGKQMNTLRITGERLREEKTMVLFFNKALETELKMWAEAKEARSGDESDIAAELTALKRATSKVTNFHQQVSALQNLQQQCESTVAELLGQIQAASQQWKAEGESTLSQLIHFPTEQDELERGESLALRRKQLGNEVVRGLVLILRQASKRSQEIKATAEIEIQSVYDLVNQAVRSEVQTASDQSLAEVQANLNASLQALEQFAAEQAAKAPPVEQEPGDPGADLLELQAEVVTLNCKTPAEADGVVETSFNWLGQMISWDDLPKTKKTPSELLSRPPGKFIHDVCCMLRDKSEYLLEELTEREDWKALESRESKVAFFEALAGRVRTDLQVEVNVTPDNILKGNNVEGTNQLLQLLALGCARKVLGPPPPPKVEAPPVEAPKVREGPMSIHPRDIGPLISVIEGGLTLMVQQVQQRQQKARQEALKGASNRDALSTQNESLQAEVNALRANESAFKELETALEKSLADVEQAVSEKEQALTEKELLVAEKQRAETRCQTLEERVHELENVANDRDSKVSNMNKAEAALQQEVMDLKTQIQVLMEERDGLRDKEEQLWRTNADLFLNLESLQESYVLLSDRCNEKQDQVMELQEEIDNIRRQHDDASMQGLCHSPALIPATASTTAGGALNGTMNGTTSTFPSPPGTAQTQPAASQEVAQAPDPTPAPMPAKPEEPQVAAAPPRAASPEYDDDFEQEQDFPDEAP